MNSQGPRTFANDAFAGQVAVVTGAASGIGAAVAQAFSGLGAHVVSLDLRPHDTRAGDRVFPVTADLADPASVDAAMTRVRARHARIHALVNCAGVYLREPQAGRVEPVVWQRTMDVNLRGLLALCRAALPALAGGGAIVNVSSVRARTAARSAIAYGVSKAMVEQATRVLAVEWAGQGVRVNAVAPGDIETPMNPAVPGDPGQQALLERCPMRRMGQPAEVAHAIVFLCSPLASYVHGVTVPVDGGFLAL